MTDDGHEVLPRPHPGRAGEHPAAVSEELEPLPLAPLLQLVLTGEGVEREDARPRWLGPRNLQARR